MGSSLLSGDLSRAVFTRSALVLAGLTNLSAALVFGTITLVFYGSAQFLDMRWWLLFALLLVYTACINLGGIADGRCETSEHS